MAITMRALKAHVRGGRLVLDEDGDIALIHRVPPRAGRDRLLAAIADVIRREARGDDIVARYGGEEFVVLSPQSGAAEAQRLAERVRAASQRFGIKECYGSLEEICRSDITALVIITQPWLHAPQVIQGMEAGKHVYLEKPVAVDVPGARKVMEIGQKANPKLSLAVGFQIRHASAYVELARRVHAGDIGAVAKLKETLTGDTLGDKAAPIQYPAVPQRGQTNPSGHRILTRYSQQAFSVANRSSSSKIVRG